MSRHNKHWLYLLLCILFQSCSTGEIAPVQNKKESYGSKEECEDSDCEVKRYESLLNRIGIAESDLKNGNSFKALKDLESIKAQAYYHGRFKPLYQLAQESCFESTNKLSEEKNSCTLVRERVSFIKTISPDKMSNISKAISNCSVDISKNSQSFNFAEGSKDIELTDEEIKASNVYEEALEIQRRYNSNPWEDLLLVDLKMLSNFNLVLGKPVIQKETPVGFIRFKVPLDVMAAGNVAYCSQYKDLIHDEDLSGTISCYDYPGLSDQMTSIFTTGSAKPQQWTEGSFVTTLKISNASKKYIRELPFTKNFKNGLLLEISYGSGKVVSVSPTLSYPGELIHNLMGRLARMSKGGEPVRPHIPEIYITGQSSMGVNFRIVKRNSSIKDFWGGYDLDIVLPLETAKDLESFKLSVPVQKIWEYYHQLAIKEDPISGASYGE